MSEYRHEFVQTLRSGKNMRDCVFRVLEQRHAADFANGQKGVKYYNDLFEAVEAAEVPEALEEYQARFFPLLDPDGSRARAAVEAAVASAAPRKHHDARWVMATLAVIALTGAILGLNALAGPPRTTPALAAAPAMETQVLAAAPAAAPTLAATTALTAATAPSAVDAEAKLAADLKPTEEGSPATAESQVVEAEPIKSESTSSQADAQ